MPKPVSEVQEAGIAGRRENFNRISRKFMEKKCNDKNKQKQNLTQAREEGTTKMQGVGENW